jgi:hypothetical protein
MVRKLKPVYPVGGRAEEEKMVMTYQHAPKGIAKKTPPTNRSYGDDQWVKRHSPQPNSEPVDVIRNAEGTQVSRGKIQSVLIRLSRDDDGEQSIEETREVHVYERNREKKTRRSNIIETREDLHEQNTVSTAGNDTAGREQENVREEIRDRFFHKSAYVQPQKNQSKQVAYEDTSRHLAATLGPPAVTRRRVSRSLSPKKRSSRKENQKQKRHSSLSPRRRVRSNSKSPKRKSKLAAGETGSTLASDVRSPQRTVKTAVSERDFGRSSSRHDDIDSGSSDEALEFTKERYKRKKSRTTNRPDVGPVPRPKQEAKKSTSPRRKQLPVKEDSSYESGSLQGTANPSSSEYESSTTGASFTEAEKLRLRRQLKRRAILKRKAAQAAQANRDPLMFMDSALANAATDFVSSLVGQLGLAQPFVFPSSPLTGESELNDEYNLLRWEDDVPPKRKSTNRNAVGISLLDLFSWDERIVKEEESSRLGSSDDDSDLTQRLSKASRSIHKEGVAKGQPKTISKPEKVSSPSQPKNAASITKNRNGSGPVVIDEKQIAQVARTMAKLQDDSMTSDDGETSGDSSSESKRTAGVEVTEKHFDLDLSTEVKDQVIEKTGPNTVEEKSVANITEIDVINLAVSSDSDEKFEREKARSNDGGDDDINSLTYSVEEGHKVPPTTDEPSNNENEASSVAKLVKKFEKELPTRRLDSSYVPSLATKQKDGTNDLAVALSLSADDSLLPTTENDGVLQSGNCGKGIETKKPEKKSVRKEVPEVPINHISELKSKIKEYRERRAEGTATRTATVSLASTEACVSSEPEFIPQEMAVNSNARKPDVDINVNTATSTTVPIVSDSNWTRSHTAAIPSQHNQSEGAKVNPGFGLGDMSVSLFGHASIGEDTLDTQHSRGPLPVDIDDMVSKIDGVVQRLIMSGKLPGGVSSNNMSDLEQRTLRNNTAELLKNLALLKSLRSSTTKRQKDHTAPKSQVPDVIQCDRQSEEAIRRTHHVEHTSSSLPTPSPVSSDFTVNREIINTTPQADSMDAKPFPNLARIRAKRDEAAMRIREKTQKLSRFGSGALHSGPIPVTMSRSSDLIPQTRSGKIVNQIDSSTTTTRIREPINLSHINEFGSGTGHPSNNLLGSKKQRGPPRPEDLSSLPYGPVKKDIRNSSLHTAARQSLSNKSLFENTKVVPMSTSDIDMEEWEQMELAKLPLLLSKTKSEEQGESRFTTINYDDTQRRGDATKRLSTRRESLRQDSSMIDEYDDVEDDDDTDDTDSSGTFGSESDSERLERIASMIQELRLRRQRKL